MHLSTAVNQFIIYFIIIYSLKKKNKNNKQTMICPKVIKVLLLYAFINADRCV